MEGRVLTRVHISLALLKERCDKAAIHLRPRLCRSAALNVRNGPFLVVDRQ
jgi:hypothetical protein